MNLSESEKKELRRLEESLWDPEVRFSTKAMDDLLDEHFFEIGASGRIYDKSQTIDAEIQDVNAGLPLPDFSVRRLGAEVVLVTYRSVQLLPDGSTKEARRSSIWVKKEKKWRIVFHQGTLLNTTN